MNSSNRLVDRVPSNPKLLVIASTNERYEVRLRPNSVSSSSAAGSVLIDDDDDFDIPDQTGVPVRPPPRVTKRKRGHEVAAKKHFIRRLKHPCLQKQAETLFLPSDDPDL